MKPATFTLAAFALAATPAFAGGAPQVALLENARVCVDASTTPQGQSSRYPIEGLKSAATLAVWSMLKAAGRTAVARPDGDPRPVLSTTVPPLCDPLYGDVLVRLLVHVEPETGDGKEVVLVAQGPAGRWEDRQVAVPRGHGETTFVSTPFCLDDPSPACKARFRTRWGIDIAADQLLQRLAKRITLAPKVE